MSTIITKSFPDKTNEQAFMQLALNQAELALAQNEVPIGCIIVNKQEELIGVGYNKPIACHDPTAHAEIECIRQACAQQKNYRLPPGCTAYVTLEPCLMCTGALLNARLDRLVVATRDTRQNSIHQHMDLFQSHFFNHRIIVEYGCLEERAKALLTQFFQERR
ncbi:nucleoside deaminase [bacterium]|nr:nucleoside deaminase [bacterium]NBW56871.1 nucleoside deaminase [bacterium]NBX72630.1 nucleoside deaminase [bacterium]